MTQITLREDKNLLNLPEWQPPESVEKAKIRIVNFGVNLHQHTYLVGKDLIWVKKELKKTIQADAFYQWIENNVWFSTATALRFMRFAHQCDEKKKLFPYHGSASIAKNGEAFKWTLNFLSNHIDLIQKGLKTQTSRYYYGGQFKVGEEVFIDLKEPRVAKIKITKLEEKTLGDFTDADAKREGYSSIEGFKRVWIKLHGEWKPGDKVKVIQFKVIQWLKD